MVDPPPMGTLYMKHSLRKCSLMKNTSIYIAYGAKDRPLSITSNDDLPVVFAHEDGVDGGEHGLLAVPGVSGLEAQT